MAEYRVLRLYRRTVSSVPTLKRLCPVEDLADGSNQFGAGLGALCPDVVFRQLADAQGKRFWGKQWLGARSALLRLTARIERSLTTAAHAHLSLAVDTTDDFGLIYAFDPELFTSTQVMHQWDCHRCLDRHELRSVDHFARQMIAAPDLPPVPVGCLTDFQVAKTSKGLVFLDFEPSASYCQSLAGVCIPE